MRIYTYIHGVTAFGILMLRIALPKLRITRHTRPGPFHLLAPSLETPEIPSHATPPGTMFSSALPHHKAHIIPNLSCIIHFV